MLISKTNVTATNNSQQGRIPRDQPVGEINKSISTINKNTFAPARIYYIQSEHKNSSRMKYEATVTTICTLDGTLLIVSAHPVELKVPRLSRLLTDQGLDERGLF